MHDKFYFEMTGKKKLGVGTYVRFKAETLFFFKIGTE